jgi:hypothetical protein
MQSQAPLAPYLGLWTRLQDFTPGELSALTEQRQVVRLHLMRNTVHLVSSRDCLDWRALFSPLHAAEFSAHFRRGTEGAGRDMLLQHAKRLLAEQPRTRAELGKLLAQRWPAADPNALAYAATHRRRAGRPARDRACPGADGGRVLTLANGTKAACRAVVLAAGVSYRRLPVPGLDELMGAGVFYGAAVTEAQAMAGQHVAVIGGANSAGQAAVHLARHAEQVTVVPRGHSLADGMSAHLVAELERAANVTVRPAQPGHRRARDRQAGSPHHP